MSLISAMALSDAIHYLELYAVDINLMQAVCQMLDLLIWVLTLSGLSICSFEGTLSLLAHHSTMCMNKNCTLHKLKSKLAHLLLPFEIFHSLCLFVGDFSNSLQLIPINYYYFPRSKF